MTISNAIVHAVFSIEELRDLVVKKVITTIDNEFLNLCQQSQSSIFRKSVPSDYLSLEWSKYICELESRSPVLFKLFKTIVSHGDHRNEKKVGDAHLPAICMAVSVLLKERNREMVGIQTCVSLLLYTSRAQKQVPILLHNSYELQFTRNKSGT